MGVTEFVKSLEEGIKACQEIVIRDEIQKVIIAASGSDAIAGKIVESFLGSGDVPVVISEDYADIEELNYKTLVIVLSEDGESEEVLSYYRYGMRFDSKLIIFNSRGKLYDMVSKNREVIRLDYNGEVGFGIAAMLTIFRNSEIYVDTVNELANTIELIKKANISALSKHLVQRIRNKVPLVFSSERLKNVGFVWKLLFNLELKRRLFTSLVPHALHSDVFTYENRDDSFYSIILRDQDDFRHIKQDVDTMKDKIKANGQDVIEINLSGKYYLLRLLSAYLICNGCVEILLDEAQQKIDDFSEEKEE